MTTALFLFGASLVVRWWYLAMNWYEFRARRQMLRGVARWKLEQRKSRSRTSGGSTNSDSGLPQTVLSESQAGVEPAEQTIAMVSDVAPPACATRTPVAVTCHPAVAATGPTENHERV